MVGLGLLSIRIQRWRRDKTVSHRFRIAAVTLALVLMAEHSALAFESSKLVPGITVEGAALESPKLSDGVVTQGNGIESSKLSAGVVTQGSGLESSKLSVGIVVANVSVFASPKLSVGVIVQSLTGSGSVLPRAPLTHW